MLPYKVRLPRVRRQTILNRPTRGSAGGLHGQTTSLFAFAREGLPVGNPTIRIRRESPRFKHAMHLRGRTPMIADLSWLDPNASRVFA